MEIISEALDSPIDDLNLLMGFAERIRIAFVADNFKERLAKHFSSSFIKKVANLIDIDSDDVKKNAIWTLSNMASVSSEAVSIIQSLKIHIKAVDIMKTSSIVVKEQCLWLLSNMASDSASVREDLLQTNLIQQITVIVKKKEVATGILENVCWLISSLCRDPSPSSVPKVKFSQC